MNIASPHPQLLGVAKGLDYLHSSNVVHGDLKGVRRSLCIFSDSYSRRPVQSNIQVDAHGKPRLSDFGLATIARDTNSLDTATEERDTTIRYSAPEILMDTERHCKESDVFAFGMVIIEVRSYWSDPR